MGIMYTCKMEITQMEGVNLPEIESIKEILKEELYEFQCSTISDEYYWSGKNGINLPFFENLSKDYKNVLFHIKSARTEDFNFDIDDITYFWFLNGYCTRSAVRQVQVIGEGAIKNWINSKQLEHIHDFSEFGTRTNSAVVLRCKCGETKAFHSNE